jgi:hypothetical protein
MAKHDFKVVTSFDVFMQLVYDTYSSEIDSNRVTVAHHGDKIIGVYYYSARYGTINDQGKADLIDYVDSDPYYPKEWG